MSDAAILYYVHDPMCSWCWAFRPVWRQVVTQLPEGLTVNYLLGGLAPDTDAAMPEALQQKIQQIWRSIQKQVPGTEFNFDFWIKCHPRRSTYAACRAVMAARFQGAEFEQKMILAIQQAYYLQARNPSDNDVVIDLASLIGLNIWRFKEHLKADYTQQQLLNEIAFSREIGAQGFPSLVLDVNERYQLLPFDYNKPGVLLNAVARQLPV